MKFDNGHKKVGGKKKGTPNKDTKAIKEAFQMLIENNLDNLTKWLNTVAKDDPNKAINHIINLSEYILPKLARTQTELSSKDDKPLFTIITQSKETAEKINKIE
jgi:hypothetical protein